jgi:hypothetical protein
VEQIQSVEIQRRLVMPTFAGWVSVRWTDLHGRRNSMNIEARSADFRSLSADLEPLSDWLWASINQPSSGSVDHIEPLPPATADLHLDSLPSRDTVRVSDRVVALLYGAFGLFLSMILLLGIAIITRVDVSMFAGACLLVPMAIYALTITRPVAKRAGTP